MDSDQLISIIIPTYNREFLITQTLDSIKKQILLSWECLIIDDGSTDNTQAVVEEYCRNDIRFKYHKRPLDLPKGAPSCRNLGFQLSQGKYIQWFDSDDIMLPNMLVEKHAALKNSTCDFVVSKMGRFKTGHDFSYPKYSIWNENFIESYLRYKIYFLTPGPMFRKEYLEKQSKLFDVSLIKHQEWEFYSRLLLTGGKGEFLNDFHCMRRMHDESIRHKTNSLSKQEKNKINYDALKALNVNTKYMYKKMLRKLFYKWIIKSSIDSIMKFRVKELLSFVEFF